MQEEILELYEKIKDQLSEEEFEAEMDAVRQSNDEIPFFDDLDCARMVLQNYGIENTMDKKEESSEELPFDVSSDEGTSVEPSVETGFTMTEEILEQYNKVSDKISEEDFLKRMEYYKNKYQDNPFMNESNFAESVVGEYVDEDAGYASEDPDSDDTIDKLEKDTRGTNICGRVISISNPRSFKTRKGQSGEVCNVELKDNTGTIRTVFWTQNIKLLKNVNEGDIIQIKDVDIKEGYSGLEANLRPRSIVTHLNEDPSRFPEYKEEITQISDIQDNTKVNIIARIVRIPTVRTYEKNGKEGKVASIELQDYSGKITYTLWNKNVELISDLGLEDGDSVKIIQAQARERVNRDGESEMTLTHWDGRIIKGDFDVPEVTQDFTLIGEVSKSTNVSIKGIVSKLQDIKKFIRKTDGNEGRLRNFDVKDTTGEIRVTLWGNDANLPINKGDIIKIIGGDVRYDDYTQSGYSMNTNFNTQITINPENLSIEELDELNALKEELRQRTPIGEVEFIDEDGIEVDIMGRILSVDEVREFQRDDGTVGRVLSMTFADESGKVRLSLWNERADESYEVGDAYQIENARTRLGWNSVDLNIGGGARLIKLSEEQASAMFIPELSTLEKALYDYKKIEEIDEDDQDVIIIGRVIELNDVRNFERDNGDTGSVRNIEIADETGSIRVVLWNDDANREFEIGQPIKLQNPRFDLDRDARIEAIVSGATAILEPSESEIERLPTQEELMEAIYVPKPIEALTEDDVNVCVTGTIVDVDTDRIIRKKCPACGNNVETSEDEFICDNCGHVFDEPRYLLMVPLRIEDETGSIKVTFFDDLAEELISMKKDEINRTYDEGYGIEDILEDLNGQTIEIVANVSFDEYSEENRLNPKRILAKYI